MKKTGTIKVGLLNVLLPISNMFCYGQTRFEGNANRIEYYFRVIRLIGGQEFQKKYRDWLNSRERKRYIKEEERFRKKKRA